MIVLALALALTDSAALVGIAWTLWRMRGRPWSALLNRDPVGLILDRLEGVRKSGSGWIAKCPAHEDRSASLSIAENEKGNAMVHCFAGCTARDVVGALGLRMGDLFLRPLGEPERKQRATHGLLKGLCAEGLRVVCAASPAGPALSAEDMGRLKTAAVRLRAALTLAGLQGRSEIAKIAGYADRILAGDTLDEIEREALTDNLEWIAWLIADETKAGYAARLKEIA